MLHSYEAADLLDALAWCGHHLADPPGGDRGSVAQHAWKVCWPPAHYLYHTGGSWVRSVALCAMTPTGHTLAYSITSAQHGSKELV